MQITLCASGIPFDGTTIVIAFNVPDRSTALGSTQRMTSAEVSRPSRAAAISRRI
jgi:hypothetical protein